MKLQVSNWSLMRLIRLATGIFIIVQGIQTNEWPFMVLGVLFSLMPLLNMGCSAAGACKRTIVNPHEKTEDMPYEEER